MELFTNTEIAPYDDFPWWQKNCSTAKDPPVLKITCRYPVRIQSRRNNPQHLNVLLPSKRQILKQIINQILNRQKIIKVLVYAIIPALLFYILAIRGLNTRGYSTIEIIRDQFQVTGKSTLIGFLSNIGIGLWVCAGAISLFTATRGAFNLRDKGRELLLLTGLLSFMLGADDFFMIHDRFINEFILYAVYAVITLSILVRHFSIISEREGFAFLLAGTLLATSICFDIFQYKFPIPYDHLQAYEEAFKFSGAATWLYYNIKMSSSFLIWK